MCDIIEHLTILELRLGLPWYIMMCGIKIKLFYCLPPGADSDDIGPSACGSGEGHS